MSAAVEAPPPPPQGLGDPIPDTAHAVSVSLPSWRSNVGYEEGEEWVTSRMRNGYPRFFLNLAIVAFQDSLLETYGKPGESVLLFPATPIARRCAEFIDTYTQATATDKDIYLRPRIVELISQPSGATAAAVLSQSASMISAVFHDSRDNSVARKFWQHTGDGVSSRRAEFFHRVFKDGQLSSKEVDRPQHERRTSICKGPRRYQRGGGFIGGSSADTVPKITPVNEEFWDDTDYARFIEERFGRNLDISLANKAKSAIRRRIAGTLASDGGLDDALETTAQTDTPRSQHGVSEDDVFLFPCGMSAIYNTHRMMLALRGSMKSVMFGFPYTDTLKVLEKFGPGAVFYGNGSADDLDDLEQRCRTGEKFLALFCEFPGNPLLKTPDLHRIRKLADAYDFAVVIDETIGNFLNINVVPAADVVVSSLTKVFSGDSNVMGGSMVLNPQRRYHQALRETIQSHYADHFWPEDAVFLERNSRDIVARNKRVNANAEALADLLRNNPTVKSVHYPKYSDSKPHYDAFRTPDGGYAGLLSVIFASQPAAIEFYDALTTAKGPSLGTNFTLSSPYSLLAHYQELDWVQQFGVDPDLIRVSVGLEEIDVLLNVFRRALDAISQV